MRSLTPEKRQFCRIYDETFDSVRKYFFRRLPAVDVDDATVEVFMVVWRRLDLAPDGDQTLPWIYGIARNVLRNQRRGYRRQARLVGRLGSLGVRSGPGTEMQVIRRVEDREVLNAVQRLRPADQEVLMLAAWECLKPREIGEVLDIDAHAASMRLLRAQNRLARELGTSSHDEALPHRSTIGRKP